MADRTWSSLVLAVALCGGTHCAVAEETSRGVMDDARDFLLVGPSRLQEMLLRHISMPARPTTPDWLLEQSHDDIDPGRLPVDDGVQLVVQDDRRDGADLLTLRYPLMESGSLRAYAGAGLNQAVYFADTGPEPALTTRRNRHQSLGSAAELGAEFRFSEQLNLAADVRWIEIDDEATLIKSDKGLVGADAVSYGVSIGWRFR